MRYLAIICLVVAIAAKGLVAYLDYRDAVVKAERAEVVRDAWYDRAVKLEKEVEDLRIKNGRSALD